MGYGRDHERHAFSNPRTCPVSDKTKTGLGEELHLEVMDEEK